VFAVSGAQAPDHLADVIRQAAAQVAKPATERATAGGLQI
jgi:predicted DsbA family dithiol-disulfide isomerase